MIEQPTEQEAGPRGERLGEGGGGCVSEKRIPFSNVSSKHRRAFQNISSKQRYT